MIDVVLRLFQPSRSDMLTRNLVAMRESVSPRRTTYVVGSAAIALALVDASLAVPGIARTWPTASVLLRCRPLVLARLSMLMLLARAMLQSVSPRRTTCLPDELRRVAAAVRNEAREGDVSGRWGGDEFVIIAAETPAPSAIALAERVRRLLSASSAPFPLTASIGVASLEHADGAERVDPELIMRVADGALYQAKMRGRNAVALAQCADGGR